ncbi:hypothetical protein [Myxococcus sp. Y35]|uniref:hypothetical protein n=1 Tax=Pseudomyxococcus flavus TaxID=3115648 RepID=UPI003CF69A00
MADFSLQLQADNLPGESLNELLVEGPWAPILKRLATGENILLEGCRGVGKTMLMRTAASRLAHSVKNGGKVLGVHTTFKRYLATIPPPGSTNISELGNFKAWVNARILSALKDQLRLAFSDDPRFINSIVRKVDWSKIISLLETTYQGNQRPTDLATINSAGLSEADFKSLQGYTFTSEILQETRKSFNLELLVLLLDDAAHALDTRAQGEFFTLVKSLYGEGLSFKIAVYPAVTRYGLDFSYGHDAIVVSLGEIPKVDTMDSYFDMLRRRIQTNNEGGDAQALIEHVLDAHPEWIRLLVYCANGNPRGLLKLISQLLTELGGKSANQVRYEHVRSAINFVMDRHLDNMVPGVVKDLDPRLLTAAELLLEDFRNRIKASPQTKPDSLPRMFLAITNSMQIPYLCSAAIRLHVAAHVLTHYGPAKLGARSRENGTLYLLHPGFMFRDNVLGGAVTADKWLQHFDNMTTRGHTEIIKSAPIWEEVRAEASQEPSARCINNHPMMEPTGTCDHCGGRATPRGPAAILLDKDIKVLELSEFIKQRLRNYGYDTVRKVFEATDEQIDNIPYIGERRLAEVRFAVDAAVDEFFAG